MVTGSCGYDASLERYASGPRRPVAARPSGLRREGDPREPAAVRGQDAVRRGRGCRPRQAPTGARAAPQAPASPSSTTNRRRRVWTALGIVVRGPSGTPDSANSLALPTTRFDRENLPTWLAAMSTAVTHTEHALGPSSTRFQSSRLATRHPSGLGQPAGRVGEGRLEGCRLEVELLACGGVVEPRVARVTPAPSRSAG
jgi:hypothetical protein